MVDLAVYLGQTVGLNDLTGLFNINNSMILRKLFLCLSGVSMLKEINIYFLFFFLQ